MRITPEKHRYKQDQPVAGKDKKGTNLNYCPALISQSIPDSARPGLNPAFCNRPERRSARIKRPGCATCRIAARWPGQDPDLIRESRPGGRADPKAPPGVVLSGGPAGPVVAHGVKLSAEACRKPPRGGLSGPFDWVGRSEVGDQRLGSAFPAAAAGDAHRAQTCDQQREGGRDRHRVGIGRLGRDFSHLDVEEGLGEGLGQIAA